MRFGYVFEPFIPSLPAKDISEYIQIVKRFSEFELRFKENYPAIDGNISSTVSILGELCKKVYSVHVHNIKLSKPTEHPNSEFISCMKSLYAKFPSLKIITFHCGNGGMNYLLRNLKTIEENFSKEELKVKLACENMPNIGSNLNSLEDVREFHSETKKMKKVGLCIDTSHIPTIPQIQPYSQTHLNSEYQPHFDKFRNLGYEYSSLICKYLSQAGEKLYHVHISDFTEDTSRKDHLMPGSGILAWNLILQTLSQMRYEGKCVIELRTEDCNLDNFEKSIKSLSSF